MVVTGTTAERPLAAACGRAAGLPPSRLLAGTLDLSGLAALVAGARLVICGDTGVAHLASAYATPSVLLFGPTLAGRWGPPAEGPHRVLWSGADAAIRTRDTGSAACCRSRWLDVLPPAELDGVATGGRRRRRRRLTVGRCGSCSSDVHGGYTDSFIARGARVLVPTGRTPTAGVACPGSGPRRVERAAERVRADAPRGCARIRRTCSCCSASKIWRVRGADRTPSRPRSAGHLPRAQHSRRLTCPHSVHPFADRTDLLIVHVTHFNAVFWDCRSAPTMIIEHGVADPGLRYTGERRALAFVVNEPVRRWRTTGTDLLAAPSGLPIDAFGIDADRLPARLGWVCPELSVRRQPRVPANFTAPWPRAGSTCI